MEAETSLGSSAATPLVAPILYSLSGYCHGIGAKLPLLSEKEITERVLCLAGMRARLTRAYKAERD
jgi:hypothetical protein